jgi:DNA-binding NarL/FixJ family response regulator
MRVLIAEADQLLAHELMASLSADERIEVVGIAATDADTLDLVETLRPDIVLVELARRLRPEALATIRDVRERTRVLALTRSGSPEDIRGAREAGADAFVTKSRVPAELAQAFVEAAALAMELGGRKI